VVSKTEDDGVDINDVLAERILSFMENRFILPVYIVLYT
jgi:hypothetical protein